MMSLTGLAAFDRAIHTANGWLADVAAEFDTDDREFVYRVTRAWLHAVRDRLPVTDAAHLGAQLPELLRGVYYDGWDPAQMPVKYSRAEFASRFATDARVSGPDVNRAARAVSTVFDKHMSGHLSAVLGHFPADLQEILRPG